MNPPYNGFRKSVFSGELNVILEQSQGSVHLQQTMFGTRKRVLGIHAYFSQIWDRRNQRSKSSKKRTYSSSSFLIINLFISSEILNLEGHLNHFFGSKIAAIFLNGWILSTGGVASGRVCACGLRSRLV